MLGMFSVLRKGALMKLKVGRPSTPPKEAYCSRMLGILSDDFSVPLIQFCDSIAVLSVRVPGVPVSKYFCEACADKVIAEGHIPLEDISRGKYG